MSNTENLQAFQVRQNDFHEARWVEQPLAEARENQLLLKVDRFALTANNITYAAYGDILGYWMFYPCAEGWGQIPVWGYADVIQSGVEGVAVGERLFGYWPMASHAMLTPKSVDQGTIVEGAEARQQLNPFYNRYSRCSADPLHNADDEDWHSIFRPLGLTAFLMNQYLADRGSWGAEDIVLASASSKTAIGMAHFLRERGETRQIGLTSSANLEFVKSLDLYDDVVEYSDIASLPQDQPSLFIDMAGDATVQTSVHEHFGAHLKHSITVGGTHWTAIRPGLPLPGPTPEFFFAPDHIVSRMSAWGAEAFQQRFNTAWASLLPRVQTGISLARQQGPAAVEDVYRAFLDGSAAANRGYILQI
tara:strand:- start:1675 stop:2760 length:1086 start_codon:yes stop_codon:yes gene_type:complete